MQMFLEIVSNNVAYIILPMAIIILVILIFSIVLSVKLSRVKKRYEKFAGGAEFNFEGLSKN